MENFLLLTSVVFALIVLIGFFNEKVTHLTYEISLLLFSVLAGCLITVIYAVVNDITVRDFLDGIQIFNLERFLVEGVLCFMLFAGSKNLKIGSFKENAKKIGVLALLCTLIGALFYGGLFYLVCRLFKLPFTVPMCLMIGSIVAPTDPIAATSILKKFGLPEKTGFLMEAESLLNDGVGVALFVCFSGMAAGTGGQGFFAVMLREIIGAVIIGLVVCRLCFEVFVRTEDKHRRIFVSLLMVSLSYFLCEELGCSGAISCVVCGVVFSALRDNAERKGKLSGLEEFDSFWETTDILLNSVLYIILGLTFIRILQMPMVVILSLVSIALNLVCRFFSVFTGTFFMTPLPDGFGKKEFAALFTWGGLRGGLSIALAMSTASVVPSDLYHIIIGSAYAIVFFTTVVQGLSMKKVYLYLTHS
ncbi:MAG: sodium:proton antiporter [Lachnospiraceae bacterium]|nr:sodium:proton antiporter [Lachnospiraceae bacterium]